MIRLRVPNWPRSPKDEQGIPKDRVVDVQGRPRHAWIVTTDTTDNHLKRREYYCSNWSKTRSNASEDGLSVYTPVNALNLSPMPSYSSIGWRDIAPASWGDIT